MHGLIGYALARWSAGDTRDVAEILADLEAQLAALQPDPPAVVRSRLRLPGGRVVDNITRADGTVTTVEVEEAEA